MEEVCSSLDYYDLVIKGKKYVEQFLEKNADIERKDQYGNTLLQYAVQINDSKITELLLKHGANPNTNDNYKRMPLHFAAMYGNKDIAGMLIDKGADIAREDGYGRVPFHYAIELCRTQIINLLLRQGANVNISFSKNNWPVCALITKIYMCTTYQFLDPSYKLKNLFNTEEWEGYTPLLWAAETGNLSLVRTLLDYNASGNSNTKNSIPLYIAVQNGHEKVVKELLDHGANVDTQTRFNETVLYSAVENQHLIIVKQILQYHPDVNNKNNKNSLNLAFYRGCFPEDNDSLEILLQHGFTINYENKDFSELMRLSIKKRKLTIIEDLLKHGANVNMQFTNRKSWTINEMITIDTPLHKAVMHKENEITLLLLNYKANVNIKDTSGKTPLFYAVLNSDLNIVKLLLTHGAKVKSDPELINVAVEQKCVEMIEILMQYGLDINYSNKNGMTALHFTSFNKNDEKDYRKKNVPFSILRIQREYSEKDDNIQVELAKFLISKGSKVAAKTKYHTTTLHGACLNGYIKVVETLLECNANVNSKMVNGITPLHFSVQNGSLAIISILLKKGANVNAKMGDGTTALHIATELKQQQIVEMLLQHGARTDIKNTNNVTPLHIAAEKNYLEIVKILLSFGSNTTFTDRCGKTPLHYAAEMGHTKIIIALLHYDFDIDFESVYKIFLDKYSAMNLDILNILVNNVVKMESINIYMCKNNLLYNIKKYDKMNFHIRCVEELKRMKSEKIINNISFFDILVKHLDQLIAYARNKSIVKVVQSYTNYKTKFPIYAHMIITRFKKGIERKEMLHQNSKCFYFLFHKRPKLPYTCVEKILSYLSNEDLKIFKYVCEGVIIPKKVITVTEFVINGVTLNSYA